MSAAAERGVVEVFRAELVLRSQAAIGEGPVWDDRLGVLWWVDIPAGRIHGYSPRHGTDKTYDVGSPVGSVVLRADRTLLLAAQDALVVLDPATRRLETLLDWPPDARQGMANDGKCDPMGRFLTGRLARKGVRGSGALYRLDPDLSLHLLLGGLTVPNGLAWSLGGGTLYFVDSSRREIEHYRYDLATGDLGRGERLMAWRTVGEPDGMTIDREGCLWVADWGGSALLRISPAGDVLATVRVPVAHVSSCTFGGDLLEDLYITTAGPAPGSDEASSESLAGSLFRARPGVRGIPAVRFAA